MELHDYDWSYEYDLGGNRTLKVEKESAILRFEDRYVYDLDNAPLYGTQANRLMKVERWQVDTSFGQSASSAGSTVSSGEATLSGGGATAPGGGPMAAAGGGGGQTDETLLSTKYYFYDRSVTEDHGNVHRVVTEKENPLPGEKKYSATRFEYAINGRAVTFALGEEWDWDGNPLNCPTDYDITFAREFRYDGARQRYLNRELKTAKLLEEPAVFESESDTWSDYSGNYIYGDFRVSGSTASDLRSFEAGFGTADAWASSGDLSTTYYHPGMLGSTRGTSVSDGTGIFNASWTAFGEKVVGSVGRYGYDGAWGYQAHDDLSSLYVGHRYYDPAIGRFLQRDPTGIFGRLNVYAYVGNNPVSLADPSGLGPLDWLYTGIWNPPAGAYDDAVDAAAKWLLAKSPVVGGYVGIGSKNNRGIVAGAGVSWTMDGGTEAYAGVGVSTSGRGRDPNTGRYQSGTGVVGVGASYGEDGASGAAFGGAGSNEKGRGAHSGVTSGGAVNLGINYGVFNCGLIIDVGKLLD